MGKCITPSFSARWSVCFAYAQGEPFSVKVGVCIAASFRFRLSFNNFSIPSITNLCLVLADFCLAY